MTPLVGRCAAKRGFYHLRIVSGQEQTWFRALLVAMPFLLLQLSVQRHFKRIFKNHITMPRVLKRF
jgi:hypothetical protein